MSELRKFREEYITLEEKQRDMESYPVAIPDVKGGNASLLQRLKNALASTSQGNQGRNIAEMKQKLIAMGSADQAEFDKEYRDRKFQNHGGSNKIQRMDNPPESSGGQQPCYNKRQGTGRIVWEQINLPKLNTLVDKVWEVVILMEEIPEPHNVGDEPPLGRRSREFCVYHRFHAHQPKNLPPPPGGNVYAKEKGKNTFVIEVGAKAKNVYCNSIIHSFRSIEDFHDTILSRVYARDADGREILNLVKVSPLKDWQKQTISFSAEQTPGGGESHECPLVVRLGINPKAKVEDDEEDEANTLGINRILIDPGSSINILFYPTYKTMGGRDEELIPSTYKIYGFNGAANKPKGEVTMRILLQNMPTEIVFCVVDVESPYNALIGRPWMHSILGVASTFHQCIKFPLPQGIGIIRGDTIESRNCQEIDIDKCE
ncbi:uncharacterized protein LOC113296220 [Papaver somniferum]|uniref:uncharacterized protein LOC113296220 n=1 Tax=Papaver somniferum TaxID=3469 RepID=UPI000E6F65B9|nr:uncharacterized protein LOC113296220 [Papaver somniferum]